MLAPFNAFQIVAAFAAWPFFISWLSEQTFRGAGVAFWISILMYVVLFFVHFGCVLTAIEKD